MAIPALVLGVAGVGCGQGPAIEVESSQEALSVAATLDDFAVFGTESTDVRDRASTAKGMVGSTGTVTIGVDAVAASDIEAHGNVILRNRAKVKGHVTTGGIVQKEPDAQITGTIVTGATVPSHPIPTATVTPGTTDVLVYRGQQLVLWPGRYRTVQVFAGGKLTVKPGTYHANRFIVESSSTNVVLDLGNQALDLRVASELRIGDFAKIDLKAPARADQIRLYSGQTTTVQIGTDTTVYGRVVAPSAQITVASRTHVIGVLHGRRVTVDTDSSVLGLRQRPPAGQGVPRIPGTPPDRLRPITTHPELLPPGARARMPAFDGQSFFVSIPTDPNPVPTPTSEEVRQSYVAPVLQALGFDLGTAVLQPTSSSGVAETPANLAGLAWQLDSELRRGLEDAENDRPPPEGCVEDVVQARRAYYPSPIVTDGERTFYEPVIFQIPSEIRVVSGARGTGSVTVAFVPEADDPDAGQPERVVCTYVGEIIIPAAVAPPVDGGTTALPYVFQNCSNQAQSGASYFIQSMVLHVVMGEVEAGETVVETTLSCGQTRPGQMARQFTDLLLGRAALTPELDKAVQASTGLPYDGFKAVTEMPSRRFMFNQVDGQVPIEFSGVSARALDGHSIDMLHGTVFARYNKTNTVTIPEAQAAAQAAVALTRFLGAATTGAWQLEEGPVLVLLPFGSDATGTSNLRYAYRMRARTDWLGMQAPFLLWLDAASGTLLRLDPLFNDIASVGPAYNRDPGIGVESEFFVVNGSSPYGLQRTGVSNRVDYLNDGYDANDVSTTSVIGLPWFPILVNFGAVPGINNLNQSLCQSGTNKGLQQVNFFATLNRVVDYSVSLGIYTPFPPSPWSPRVESATAGCNAWSDMDYGACRGYTDAACPSYSTGTDNSDNWMNFAHDNSVVIHELGHNITSRFSSGRPGNWCGTPPCAMPAGWGNFHDIADFWGDHLESTNCSAGWVAKNQFGVDASLNCLRHFEDGNLPRRHVLPVPFNPAAAEDHYPEHRLAATGEYAEMQMLTAILWEVRTGMRSIAGETGLTEFESNFADALKAAGFTGAAFGANDLGLYEQMLDLETQMVQRLTININLWFLSFTFSSPRVHEILAGFARGGIFMIPSQCIDGSAATTEPRACPSGENGADAVVDVEDNDATDDVAFHGVPVVERDHMRRSGPAPTFHVWTGARYVFSGTGAVQTGTAPCNAQYIVELSTTASFDSILASSGWITVDRDLSTPASPECYGSWTPTAAQWRTIGRGSGLWGGFPFIRKTVYYRTRTRAAGGGNERVSTEPGAGLFQAAAPSFIVNLTGGPIL